MREQHEKDINQVGRSQGNTSKRGFASMSSEEQRAIASKGGKAAHEQGVAHEWNSKEASEAGKKGGLASHAAAKQSGKR